MKEKIKQEANKAAVEKAKKAKDVADKKAKEDKQRKLLFIFLIF